MYWFPSRTIHVSSNNTTITTPVFPPPSFCYCISVFFPLTGVSLVYIRRWIFTLFISAGIPPVRRLSNRVARLLFSITGVLIRVTVLYTIHLRKFRIVLVNFIVTCSMHLSVDTVRVRSITAHKFPPALFKAHEITTWLDSNETRLPRSLDSLYIFCTPKVLSLQPWLCPQLLLHATLRGEVSQAY